MDLVNASGDGVRINGGPDILVEGNYIGLAPDGTTIAANGGNGLELDASSGNTIGGSTAQARNVISGNLKNGILIDGSSNNRVEGNFIGTDATGTLDRGNKLDGVKLENSDEQRDRPKRSGDGRDLLRRR